MNLRQIKQFLALAEAKNFYGAADKIGLTQSALTQAISKLEKELGLQLFIRSKSGTILTEHGKRLEDHARVILAQVEIAEAELRSRAKGTKQVIKLGIVESLPDPLILQALSRFNDRYANYNVKLIKDWSAALMPMLTSGDVDFAILSDHFLAEDIPEVTREPLFKERVAVVVGGGHPLGDRDAIELADLEHQRWVSVTVSNAWANKLIRTFAAAGLAPPKQIIQTNSITFASYVICQGEAVGLVTPSLFREANKSKAELRFFDVPELQGDRRFSICRRTRTVLRPAHVFLLDSFKQVIATGLGQPTGARANGRQDPEQPLPGHI